MVTNPPIVFSNAIPLIESGSGSAGTAPRASKGDHVHPASGVSTALIAANNLSDLPSKPTARDNLGLGSAAVASASAFDAAGASAAVQTSSVNKASNLSDVASALTARRNLNLAHLWLPSDQGFLASSFDLSNCGTGRNFSTGGAAGVLQLVRLKLPVAATITNILLISIVAGSSLTTGQNFAALFSSAGVLLKQTVDQAANWNTTTGLVTMALSSTYSAAAGDYYVGIWYNGSSAPTCAQSILNATSPQLITNPNLSSPNMRTCTSTTGLTTTAPNPFGAQTSSAVHWWFGLN